MSLDNDIKYVRDKVDAIHADLSAFNGRLSAAEEALTWMKGHVSIVSLVVLAIIGALLTKYII